jgi:hypothetical protein
LPSRQARFRRKDKSNRKGLQFDLEAFSCTPFYLYGVFSSFAGAIMRSRIAACRAADVPTAQERGQQQKAPSFGLGAFCAQRIALQIVAVRLPISMRGLGNHGARKPYGMTR